MMIKVEAYVREDKFEDVKAALNAIGVNGLPYLRSWAAVSREVIKKLFVVCR